ncbi:MAG: hypothetical protein JW936_07920 [Sedimentisphaerales bacterium]|nr:hypothetical protein [Sedimentisphaerales bacterium]
MTFDLAKIRCVLFDFGGTLYSGRYFADAPEGHDNWQEILDLHVFGQPLVLSQWLLGRKNTVDIAGIVAEHIKLPVASIVKQMEDGCRDLKFNPNVILFAQKLKQKNITTALVTLNMDIFSNVVVPSHGLDQLFGVIVNSADIGTLNKEVLWQKAFELVGDGIGFADSLLLEDNACNLELFGRRGGKACAYKDEKTFYEWLTEIGLN